MKVSIICLGLGSIVLSFFCGSLADERNDLRDRLSQQQYQLEVLVCRFNDKQPGEWAEFLPDGTVGYWKRVHPGTVDPSIYDTTGFSVQDTLYYWRP